MATGEDLPCSDLRYCDRTVAFVDVVESVRLIEFDEAGAVTRIRSILSEAENQIVPAHQGRVVERRGDGLLLEFPEGRSATACALALHAGAARTNLGTPVQSQVHLRIGVHRAQVITDDGTLLGHGVNLASRITTLASPNETVVSAAVAGELVNGVDGVLEDLGPCHVKHIGHPIHAYRVRDVSEETTTRPRLASARLQPAIAVMPFLPYQGDRGGLGIGDIVTDQLIGALSRSNSINVISRLSTSALRARNMLPAQIGERLSSEFVVSGRYWRKDGKIHVHAELARAANGYVIWGASLEDVESAAIDRESHLLGALLKGISEALFASEVRKAAGAPLTNVASHTLLLAAINLLYRLAPDDFDRAHAALQTLNERMPRHPVPLAWLARWHLFRVVQGWSANPAKDGEMARTYAHRALDADPECALALTMAGNVETNYVRDLDAAERLYNAALVSNPNESLAWLQKGNALSFRGDGKAALSHIEKAVRLSPLDPSRHFYDSLLASAALSAGDYERAIGAAQSSLQMNAHHVSSYRVLAIAQSLTGRMADATQTVNRILMLEPNLTVTAFVARSPGGKSGLAKKFGQALLAAGLPS